MICKTYLNSALCNIGDNPFVWAKIKKSFLYQILPKMFASVSQKSFPLRLFLFHHQIPLNEAAVEFLKFPMDFLLTLMFIKSLRSHQPQMNSSSIIIFGTRIYAPP